MFEKFVNENKFLREKKYHKGLGFDNIMKGKTEKCIICSNPARHFVLHNRKTDRKKGRTHDGLICFNCVKDVQNFIQN